MKKIHQIGIRRDNNSQSQDIHEQRENDDSFYPFHYQRYVIYKVDYTALILTQMLCSLATMSSYPLAMISSFMTLVVPLAMIHASTIAPPHLRSVEETYPPLSFVGQMTIAS